MRNQRKYERVYLGNSLKLAIKDALHCQLVEAIRKRLLFLYVSTTRQVVVRVRGSV